MPQNARIACHPASRASTASSSAFPSASEHGELPECLRHAEPPSALLEKGVFRFRSLEEARALANTLSRACPNPEKSVIGIEELLINAVEHGNLGISYEEKTQLLLTGTWADEVRYRLASPLGRERSVTVQFERFPDDSVRIEIRDEGDGFDWRPYVDFDVDRAFDNHGRGIAMAKALSFDSLQYCGNGNTVVATIRPIRP
jgi:anti-sigma regulatory factor (Ser/Thr protein kinase)